MSVLVLVLIFAVVCNVALSLECPTSCPRVVTSTGVSNCCSIGDKATGCGVCEYTTCSENNFANCVENYGIVCSASTAGCSVKSVEGKVFSKNFTWFEFRWTESFLVFTDVTAGQNRLGVIVGGISSSILMTRVYFRNSPVSSQQYFPSQVPALRWVPLWCVARVQATAFLPTTATSAATILSLWTWLTKSNLSRLFNDVTWVANNILALEGNSVLCRILGHFYLPVCCFFTMYLRKLGLCFWLLQ